MINQLAPLTVNNTTNKNTNNNNNNNNNNTNNVFISKIISLVIFVCLAMWSIRNLKDHDVSCAICNTSSGDKN